MNESRLASSQKLLQYHTKRLEELQYQAAMKGSTVDPSISIEIEEISVVIERLKTRIGEATQLERTLRVCDDIFHLAQEALFENQRVLVTYFLDNSKRDWAHNEMSKLYHYQNKRGEFGRWKAVLELHTQSTTDTSLKQSIQALLKEMRQINVLFYQYDMNTKASIVDVLDNKTKFPNDSTIVISSNYLNKLRELTENIGYTTASVKYAVEQLLRYYILP